MTTFISIMTSVVLALIFVGIILGFFRGWVKSLIRMGCVLVSLLLAIFIGPAISGKLVEKFVQGTSFVGFGLSVDFEESLTTLFGDANFSADLLAANGTTHDLAVAVINVVLNIVCFLLIFFAVYLLSH